MIPLSVVAHKIYVISCIILVFLFFVFRVAEKLLPGSRFHRYTRDGQFVVKSSAPYSVPDDVHQHLDFGKNFQVEYFLIGLVMGHSMVFISVPSQLADFIVSLVKCSRTAVEPISNGSRIASRQEFTWG